MKFNCVVALLANAGLLAVSASEIELWVSVICSAVIAIVTCGLQVYKMIRDAKENKTDSVETDEKDTKDGDSDGKE